MSSNRNSITDEYTIGPDDPTVEMPAPALNVPLCARCQHEMAYADTTLEPTVTLPELPMLLRRQAE